MHETRGSLIKAWRGFTSAKDGLRHTDDDDEGQNCDSPAVTFVERLIKALRMTVREEILSEEAWTLTKLEAMLEDTPGLVHRSDEPPANEGDLQEIMHDYLSACFPDFRLNPAIGGTIKNFKPDCGIASVGAAIEFKIPYEVRYWTTRTRHLPVAIPTSDACYPWHARRCQKAGRYLGDRSPAAIPEAVHRHYSVR